MAFIICKNGKYLVQTDSGYTIVSDKSKASKWNSKVKTDNVLKCINNNKTMRNHHLEVKFVDDVRKVELDYDILEKVRDITKFTKDLEERRNYLNSELSRLDMEVVDIVHAAELFHLNAAYGYKIYKLLHDVTNERRKIKNELAKINYSLGGSLKSNSMANVERSIEGLDNRKYTPRVLTELFGV